MGVTASWKPIWPGEDWPEPAIAGGARTAVARAARTQAPTAQLRVVPNRFIPNRFIPNIARASRFLASVLARLPLARPEGQGKARFSRSLCEALVGPGAVLVHSPRALRPKPVPL